MRQWENASTISRVCADVALEVYLARGDRNIGDLILSDACYMDTPADVL